MKPSEAEAIVARERAVRDHEAELHDKYLAEDPYLRRAEQAVVLSALDPQRDDTVIDAGCGTGRMLEQFLDRAGRVVGVDHSPASIEVARARVPEEKRDRLRLVAGDVRSMPLEDATADRMVCIQVLQHLPTPEFRLEAARELRRVLKPGGVLVALVYRWRGHIRRHKEGYFGSGLYRYAFTVGEFRRLLEEGGFQEVRAGGAVVLPALSERLGVSIETQCRVVFTAVGRHLAQYVVARARA